MIEMVGEQAAWAVAIAVFAFVMTFTPGPNNIMLATSGVNFGVRRSMPHVIGVALGFPAMLLVVGSGLGLIFLHQPFDVAIRTLGLIYILYLAYRIGSTDTLEGRRSSAPLSMLQAAGFQWVNPKAWAQAIGVTSAYLIPGDSSAFMQILVMAAIFLPIGIASSYIWVVFGAKIARFLDTRRKLRIFNVVMALALVFTVLPVLIYF